MIISATPAPVAPLDLFDQFNAMWRTEPVGCSKQDYGRLAGRRLVVYSSGRQHRLEFLPLVEGKAEYFVWVQVATLTEAERDAVQTFSAQVRAAYGLPERETAGNKTVIGIPTGPLAADESLIGELVAVLRGDARRSDIERALIERADNR